MGKSIQRHQREYKDRLFKKIFSDRRDLLELYNALNGTSYDNPDDIVVNTLEDVIYLGMKNDISFILKNILSLYEHQSTLSPNLPLRGMLYIASVIRQEIVNTEDLYSSRPIALPLPKFVVFYNGTREEPERREMFLHDLYPPQFRTWEADLDCRAVVLNINAGHNMEIMKKCRKLEEYSIFVARIRRYQNEGNDIGEAVDHAVDDCIREGVLEELLRSQREEVRSMLLTEYDEERHIENERRIAADEAYARGAEWGREAGLAEGEKKGLARGKEEGLAEGEKLFGELTNLLLKASRIEDLKRAAEDLGYRRKLYREFGLKI